MKVSFALVALVAADDRKVPPRHPSQRLNKLVAFAHEWIGDNLNANQAARWNPKIDRNAGRLERRFDKCGFYDEDQLPHGGPEERKRRDADDDLFRYDTENPATGLRNIMGGFRKWAERYAEGGAGSGCGRTAEVQANRFRKWQNILMGKL